MEEAYRTHLQEVHSKLEAPPALVEEIVKEATGSNIETKQRIVAGEANEVYDIGLTNSTHIIVRISRDAEKHFEQEHWAIEECRKLDLPVPEVLLLKHLSTDDEPLDICVQKKLEGELLERGAIDATTLPPEDLRSILHEAGEMLARIHSVPTAGWGYLNHKGEGTQPTFHTGWNKFIVEEQKYTQLAERTGFDTGLMHRIFTYLSSKGQIVPEMSPVLTHNDFHPKHLMIKDNHVVGIIDFGEVTGHISENDLAKWKYWDDSVFPIEWVIEGYSKGKLGEYFTDLMSMLQLEHGLGVLDWYDYKKYGKGVDDAKKKIAEVARDASI